MTFKVPPLPPVNPSHAANHAVSATCMTDTTTNRPASTNIHASPSTPRRLRASPYFIPPPKRSMAPDTPLLPPAVKQKANDNVPHPFSLTSVSPAKNTDSLRGKGVPPFQTLTATELKLYRVHKIASGSVEASATSNAPAPSGKEKARKTQTVKRQAPGHSEPFKRAALRTQKLKRLTDKNKIVRAINGSAVGFKSGGRAFASSPSNVRNPMPVNSTGREGAIEDWFNSADSPANTSARSHDDEEMDTD